MNEAVRRHRVRLQQGEKVFHVLLPEAEVIEFLVREDFLHWSETEDVAKVNAALARAVIAMARAERQNIG